MIHIPNTVKIGGFTYRIIKDYVFKERNDLRGQADHSLLEIRIGSIDPNTGIPYAVEIVEETFIHEILHCVAVQVVGHELEESVIIRLGFGLFQVLKDNDIVQMGK